jgi:hypothetical protein
LWRRERKAAFWCSAFAGTSAELTLRHVRNPCRLPNSKSELMLNIFLSGECNFEQFSRDERLCQCQLQLESAFPKFGANSNVVQTISEGKRECGVVQWRR